MGIALHATVGEENGALASYNWHKESYPNDGENPCQYLTWTLALYRGGLRHEAFNKPYQTMLENRYLVPHLLGWNSQTFDRWHGSNLEWIDYLLDVPQERINLWGD